MKKYLLFLLCLVFGAKLSIAQTITISTATISGQFSSNTNSSTSRTFTMSGTGLTANVNLSISTTDWEISTNNTNFFPTLSLTQSGGTLTGQPLTIFVRLKSGLTMGIKTATLTASSTGATNQIIALTGTAGAFVTTWITTTNNVVILTNGTGYNYDIVWTNLSNAGVGDGTITGRTGVHNITGLTNGDTYQVAIVGAFPTLFMNGVASETPKIRTIRQWGNITWGFMFASFAGCSNLTYQATDNPNLSGVTNMAGMFFGCTNFNGNISSWDVSNVTNMAFTFVSSGFNQNIGAWNITNVTNMTNMFGSSNMSRANYDATLIGWASQNVQNNVPLGASGREYCNAQNARNNTLIALKNWNITGDTYNCIAFNVSAFANTGFYNTPTTTSAVRTFTVSGTNLISPIGLSLSTTDWLLSLDGINFTSNLFLFPTSGTVATQTVYIVLKSGLSPGAKSANLTINTSGVPNQIIPLRGITGNFITNWITTTTNITIPTTSTGYNYSIWWVNLTNPGVNEGFATAQTGNYTLTGLSNGDTYQVAIFGAFPRFFMNNNATERSKIRSIVQWGNNSWASMSASFWGCNNLNYDATDNPNLGGVTDMSQMFADCSVFNGNVGNWNVGNVNNMTGLFSGASVFNQSLNGWNTSNVTNMTSMFENASLFNQSLANWNVTNVTNMTNMLNNCGMNRENYDATLIDWSSQNVKNNVPLGATNRLYCVSLSQRFFTLINDKGWTITGDNYSCNGVGLSTTFLGGFYNNGSNPSVARTFTISGINITANVNLSISNTEWEISTDNINFFPTLTLTRSGSNLAGQPVTIFVRLKGGLSEGTKTATLTASTAGYPNQLLTLRGTVGAFVTTWVTNTGNIFIPTAFRAYNYDIIWTNLTNAGVGDGFATGQTSFYNITGLANGDTYQIAIFGIFPHIPISAGSERLKIRSIAQWGNIAWGSMQNAFQACQNLVYQATDIPNLSNVTNMDSMFATCNLFNGDVSGWNTSNVTSMRFAFFFAYNFDQSLANWNVSNVTDMTSMLTNCGMNIPNYDATLIGWASQNVKNNVPLGAVNLRYCQSQQARNNTLIAQKNWNIQSDIFQNVCLSGTRGNMVNFNGASNQYVTLANNPLSNATAMTIETWVRPTANNTWCRILDFGDSAGDNMVLIASQSNSGIPIFAINVNNTGSINLNAPNPIPLNTWTHIAVTLSGTTATMYINGIQVAQNTSFNANPASLGATANNWFGRSQYTSDAYFSGNMEEMRLWNVARTQKQIRENMHLTLSGREIGLVAYYQFNELAGNNNILDVVRGNNGTLQNGVSRNTSTLSVGGGRSETFAVGNTGLGSTEIPFSATSTEINFTNGGTAPNGELVVFQITAESPHNNLPTNTTSCYWIVRNFGTNQTGLAIENIAFRIPNHNLISTIDEATPSNLKLYKRNDNSGDATWGSSPVGNCILANNTTKIITFNAGFTSFSEFIISSGTSPLPITLLSFEGKRQDENNVLLNWKTLTELNNAGFEVQISENGQDFSKIAFVDGAGNSNSIRNYELGIKNDKDGYYRLKQIDFDGKFTYSNIIFIKGFDKNDIKIYPNPASDFFQIKTSLPDFTYKITDIQGKLFDTKHISQDFAKIDISNLSNGIYLIQILQNGKNQTKKMVIQK